MMQLALPMPTPSREDLGALCHVVGRHVCDADYLWCTAFGEAEWLGWGLERVHRGDVVGARACLSHWQKFLKGARL